MKVPKIKQNFQSNDKTEMEVYQILKNITNRINNAKSLIKNGRKVIVDVIRKDYPLARYHTDRELVTIIRSGIESETRNLIQWKIFRPNLFK